MTRRAAFAFDLASRPFGSIASHATTQIARMPSRLARNRACRTRALSTLSSPLPSHVACTHACPLCSIYARRYALSLITPSERPRLSPRTHALSRPLASHAITHIARMPALLSDTPSHYALSRSPPLCPLTSHAHTRALSPRYSQARSLSLSHHVLSRSPSRFLTTHGLHALSHPFT